MGSLTAVFFLIAVVFFFWGLVAVFKPGCAIFLRKQWRTRGRGFISGFLLALIFLVCAGVAAPQKKQVSSPAETSATNSQPTSTELGQPTSKSSFWDTPAESDKNEANASQDVKKKEATPPPAAPQEIKTIGINATQLAKRMNAALSEIKSPYKMAEKPNIERGSVNDVVKYLFSEKFSTVITIDKKTQNVIGLMTIITPSSDRDENLVLTASNAAVISAFEGKGQLKTVGKRTIDILNKALSAYAETHQDQKESFILNDKKYTVNVSSSLGILTYAELAD